MCKMMTTGLIGLAPRRKRACFTQQAFADALGVNERTVKNWQHGRTAMPLSKLVKICSILGCRADYLLGLEVSV